MMRPNLLEHLGKNRFGVLVSLEDNEGNEGKPAITIDQEAECLLQETTHVSG